VLQFTGPGYERVSNLTTLATADNVAVLIAACSLAYLQDWGPAFVPAGVTGGVELVGFDRATLIGGLQEGKGCLSSLVCLEMCWVDERLPGAIQPKPLLGKFAWVCLGGLWWAWDGLGPNRVNARCGSVQTANMITCVQHPC
jgi:hypothetical protein